MDSIIGITAHQMGFHVHGVVPANRYKVHYKYLDYCTSVEYMAHGTSFMQRNDRIVLLSEILTAFPKTSQEELRSGTWATIRRGWKKGIPVEIIPLS